MNPLLLIACILLWLYILRILRIAELRAWRFVWGAAGLFVLFMLGLQPILTKPLIRVVSALAGGIGSLTKTFTAYFKFGILFISLPAGSITLQVDFECSGIIEIMAFVSLLTFFNVYTRAEKLLVGIVGCVLLILFNVIRIVLICFSVHFFGLNAYYITHMFIGRLVFYACSVGLYFYVFTKPQILQMKIGNFAYGLSKKNS